MDSGVTADASTHASLSVQLLHGSTTSTFSNNMSDSVKQQSPKSSDTERCYLLEIPPELRLRIYDYAFSEVRGSDGGRVRVFCLSVNHSLTNWKTSLPGGSLGPVTALLQTCRTVYLEARGGFYNLFCFFLYPGYLQSGKATVKQAKDIVRAMRQISIRCYSHDRNLYNVSIQDIKELCKMFAKYGQQPHLTDVDFCCERGFSSLKEKIVEDLKEFVADTSLEEVARKICSDVIDQLPDGTG
jgi:predicted house-cleaning noncanonical NTP pyrophosphatase (MazG superfamily)